MRIQFDWVFGLRFLVESAQHQAIDNRAYRVGRFLAPGGFVAGTDKGQLRFWDGIGSTPRECAPHSGFIHSIDLDPSGGRLVTASRDGTAKVFEPPFDRCVAVLTLVSPGGPIHEASFSADGSLIATAGHDATWVWDIERCLREAKDAEDAECHT